VSRIRRSVVLTAGILGLLTAVGLAFFIGSFAAEGTHTGTAGSGGTGKTTLPIAVSFPNGELTPTHPVEVTAEVNNTTSKAVTFSHFVPAVTTGAVGCKAEWFRVVATGTGAARWNENLTEFQAHEETYAPGTRSMVTTAGTHLMLEMQETGTDQSACESASVTVAFKLS
jgi:hypothetical protein